MTFKEIASKIKVNFKDMTIDLIWNSRMKVWFEPTISPVLISVIVICYLCIGAIIFAHIEHSPELIKKRNGVEKFAEALDSFEDFQCKNETNSSVLRAKLKKILITWDEISTEYKLTQSDIDGLPIETDWSYYESLLFTYSLITTIGKKTLRKISKTPSMIAIETHLRI